MTDFLKIAKSIVVHFAHICAYGVETDTGLSVAQIIGAYAYLECSAKLNDGVKDVFDMVFRAIFPGAKHVLCLRQ